MQRRVDKDHVPHNLLGNKALYKQPRETSFITFFIDSFIEELGRKYNIKEINFDRWRAVQMTQDFDGIGFTVVPFRQGFKDMSPSTKELINLLLSKRTRYKGHPVLHWMMDNISASEQIRQETSKWTNPNLSKKNRRSDCNCYGIR